MWNRTNPNKYNAKKISQGGRIYDSKLEAGDALYLHQLEKNREITELKEQVRYRIFHEGCHICDSIVDFQFVHKGILIWFETKGFVTDVYKIKRKLMEAEMKGRPDERYIVNAQDLMRHMRGR